MVSGLYNRFKRLSRTTPLRNLIFIFLLDSGSMLFDLKIGFRSCALVAVDGVASFILIMIKFPFKRNGLPCCEDANIFRGKSHYIIIIGTTRPSPSSKCSVVYVIISESHETRLVPISIRAISINKIESRDISNRKYFSKTILACREQQAKKRQ